MDSEPARKRKLDERPIEQKVAEADTKQMLLEIIDEENLDPDNQLSSTMLDTWELEQIRLWITQEQQKRLSALSADDTKN